MGLLLKFLRKLDVKTGQHRCRPSSAQAVRKQADLAGPTASWQPAHLLPLRSTLKPGAVGKVAKFNGVAKGFLDIFKE